MQLYARDQEGRLCGADSAERQTDYLCMECGGVVRARSAQQRRAHFFHLRPTAACRSSEKSLEHIQAQCLLQKQIGPTRCQLEAPFPQIKRIADVYWPEENLIFEVQCSPITAKELEARNRDYESLGLQVIWIFHDKRYNQLWLSGAELALTTRPHYYTNINGDGVGNFYTRYALIEGGQQTESLPPIEVNLTAPHRVVDKIPKDVPRIASNLLRMYPTYFQWDIVDITLNSPAPYATYREQIFVLEQRENHESDKKNNHLWYRYLHRPYVAVLHALLENVSR